MADKRVPTNVTLSPEIHAQLMKESEDRMVGASRLVERALIRLFDSLPPIHHSLAPVASASEAPQNEVQTP